jgi:hypothetical protein
MTQRAFERIRRVELNLGIEPSHYEPGAERHDPAAGDSERVATPVGGPD